MLPLSANPDFKDVSMTITNPFMDLNGDDLSKTAVIFGTDALDQAIEAIIVTEPYERLFNIEFYSPFYKLLFENENVVDDIMAQVYDKIEQYVGVVVDRSGCDVRVDTQNHRVSFKLPYLYNHQQQYHIFSRVISA